MTPHLPVCMLALATALALPCFAQSKPPNQNINSADQNAVENSAIYKQAYREGERDRSKNLTPLPRGNFFVKVPDRKAYDAGYMAGYCSHEDKTGYYDGSGYHDWGDPYSRGYYGYNAPNPACANQAPPAEEHH